MNVDRFVAERTDAWSELEELVARARAKPERLGAAGVRRLGALYRSAAADLATGRRLFPREPAIERLAALVGRARHLVYDTGATRESLRDFVSRGYWRRIRERPALLAVAALLLLAPAVAAWVWALTDPAAAAGLVPSAFRSVTEPQEAGRSLGLSGAESLAFSTQIFVNNIRVVLLAFAAGMTAGIATGYVLVTNGLLLGAVGGLAAGAGNGERFTELGVAHGVLELALIVVGAAAGLRVGWAIVDPGHRRRGEAAAAEAKVAIEIALGTAAWLVLCGLVEGFVTPAGHGLAVNTAVGIGIAVVFWTLVVWRGRPAPAAVTAGRAPPS